MCGERSDFDIRVWRRAIGAVADLDNEHSHIVFVYGDDYWSDVYASGYGLKSTIRNPQAEGFWERLWPAFIAELPTGAVPVTLATVNPPRDRRTKLGDER